VTFHFSHIPSAATGVYALHGFSTQHGSIGFNNIVYDQSTSVIQDGAASITMQVPDIQDVDVHALLDYVVDMRGNNTVRELRALADSYDLDLAGVLLPDWMESPHYDAANRRIAWLDAPGGAVPDLLLGSLSVSHQVSAQVAAAPPAQGWSWRLIAPYTAGELKLPILSADIADWTPLSTDRVGGSALPFKLPRGYDAIRSKIFDEANADANDQMLLRLNERIVHVED
jgi:hypothetical protein